MDEEQKDRLVRLAYERYLRLKDAAVDDRAVATLTSLHEQIAAWDGSLDTIDFYAGFLTGKGMEAVASCGMAETAVDTTDFIDKMSGTRIRQLVGQLLEVRRQAAQVDDKLAPAIAGVQFYKRVVDLTSFKRGRPKQFVGRFLLAIFVECMTTIAKQSQLEQTAILLGKNPQGVPFEKLQIQVRGSVEGALGRLKLDNEDWNIFNRAAVAYHIVDAAKEAGLLRK